MESSQVPAPTLRTKDCWEWGEEPEKAAAQEPGCGSVIRRIPPGKGCPSLAQAVVESLFLQGFKSHVDVAAGNIGPWQCQGTVGPDDLRELFQLQQFYGKVSGGTGVKPPMDQKQREGWEEGHQGATCHRLTEQPHPTISTGCIPVSRPLTPFHGSMTASKAPAPPWQCLSKHHALCPGHRQSPGELGKGKHILPGTPGTHLGQLPRAWNPLPKPLPAAPSLLVSVGASDCWGHLSGGGSDCP